MKKLLILAVLAAALPLNAQDLLNKRHSLSIAAEISSYKYKEPSAYPISDSGTFAGIWAEYIMRGKPAAAAPEAPFTYFLAVEGNFMTGNVDYDGWLYSNPPPVYTKYEVSGIQDYFAELRLKAGALWRAGTNWEFQPYAGLGARYLVDQMEKKSPYGYHRTDLYIYIPMGIKARASLPRGWALTFGGELDWFLLGKQKSRMSDIDGADYNDITFDQGSGYGARLSARADKSFKRMGIFIEPFLRYWNIKESEPGALYDGGTFVGLFVEPHNTTTEYGIRAGIFF